MQTPRGAVLVVCAAALGLAPVSADAQPRVRVSVAAAAATVDEDADLALAGSLGYRFARGLWFEGEVTWIDQPPRPAGDLAIPLPLPPDPPVTGHPGEGSIPGTIEFTPIAAEREGTVLIGTLGLRYELPVETERVRPYLAGGIGLNQSDEQLRVATSGTVLEDTSHSGYAFAAGAGVSIRLFRQAWTDIDARYFRLSQSRNSMRLGGGLSIRF